MTNGRHRRRPEVPDADAAGNIRPRAGRPPDLPEEPVDTPADKARRGKWRLVVAVVLFATVVLPKLVGPESYTGSAPALSGPSASATPSAAAGASPLASPRPSSTDGDPFRTVRPGQCLSVHRDPSDGRGWSAAAPTAAVRVRCDAADARVRVSAVRSNPADCPGGGGTGHWSAPAPSSRSLCLTRQFRQDDCLFAAPEDSADGVRADLMSAPECDTRSFPEPYDRVLAVTGVLPDVARPAPPGLCMRQPHDGTSYAQWRVGDGGEAVVCAAEAGREHGAD